MLFILILNFFQITNAVENIYITYNSKFYKAHSHKDSQYELISNVLDQLLNNTSLFKNYSNNE